jgi:hypothetical protein
MIYDIKWVEVKTFHGSFSIPVLNYFYDTIKGVISLQELTNVNLDANLSRVDFIYNMEMLKQEDLSSYVYEFLLPNLQKSYNYAKEHLPGKTRKNIYNVQKYLADLIDDQEYVKLSINSDNDSIYYTKHESLFLLVENLNRIYFFSAILRSKIKDSFSNYTIALRNLMKIALEIHREICTMIELS